MDNLKGQEGGDSVDVEEDEDEKENESSSDDTEEEIEPKLRYERIKNDVPKILHTDAASCVAITVKFLALGTHLGYIYILDLQGNKIKEKELVLHVTTVNQISFDESGEYIASCSNDGKAVVHGILASDLNASVTIDRPIRSIALDPSFSKSSSNRRFIIGEDKVVLYEKNILGWYKPTVLYQGEGTIRNIQWKERFIVWSSDKAVRVYDLSARITVTVIMRDSDPALRPELYRCNFFWKDSRTLLIGWANTVKVCSIVPYDNSDALPIIAKDQPRPPRFYALITSMFNTDFCISGISAMGDSVVVLTVLKDTEVSQNVGLRPQLRVLDPLKEDFKPVSSDILTLYGYESYRNNDYHLDSLSEEGLYFILSPKDFVVAIPRDEDDHVAWLLEHEKFKEAVDAVLKGKKLKKHSLLDVGQAYLDYLLLMKRYGEAAELCSVIYESNNELWQEEVYRFQQLHQLRAIAPYLPTDEPLDKAAYEMVLNEFLQTDPKGLLNLIRKWPSDLYSIPTIITAIKDRLSVTDKTMEGHWLELNESLCELYIRDKNYDAALSLYLAIRNKDKVFQLIQDHNLFGSIHDKLEILMELNPTDSTKLLIDNMEMMPVELVVSKLKQKRRLLFEYLTKVTSKDPTLAEDQHSLMVDLYAEYCQPMLLSFLRSSNNYALEHALDICRQRNLINEVIFLLGRMGDTKQALNQITHVLQDIDRAIEFCKEHDEKELWEDLIDCSLDKPGFITVLLQNIGTHVDPIMLIKKIPDNMEIPGLRDSLVKILLDYNLQISVREGCEKIVVADCFNLLEKLNKCQKKGIFVRENQVCQACENRLISDARYTSDIYIFNCRHGFHKNCIDRTDACSVCRVQKRGPGTSQMLK